MSSKRRWFQYSLRTFLVLVTCVALAIAWFANHARQRRAALESIRQAGGSIQMYYREPNSETLLEKWFGRELFEPVMKVDLRKGIVDNELLRHIGVLKELKRLDLTDAQIDDEGLHGIAHLPLVELWLQNTKITDAPAATLSQLKSLEFLQLNANSLTDAFLEHLEVLPELDNLGLRGTLVTNAGLKHLSRYPKLKKLYLYQTSVDDSGVLSLVGCQSLVQLDLGSTKVTNRVFEHLARLPNLEDVDLNASPVTTEAVLAFEKAHPKCDVEWYQN
jgi:Leucine-rich repeat (LRR) protein